MISPFNKLGPFGKRAAATAPPSGGLPDHSWLVNFDAMAGLYSDAGITPAVNGDSIQEWLSQSGGNHARQATPSARPTLDSTGFNGLPVVNFDPDNATHAKFMDLDSDIDFSVDGPFAMFVVGWSYPPANTSDLWQPIGGLNYDDQPVRWRSNAYYVAYRGRGYAAIGPQPAIRSGLYSHYAVDGLFTLRINGAHHGDQSTWSTQFGTGSFMPYIGRHLKGGMSQLLYTEQALSVAEVEEVDAFLAQKWNITIP